MAFVVYKTSDGWCKAHVIDDKAFKANTLMEGSPFEVSAQDFEKIVSPNDQVSVVDGVVKIAPYEPPKPQVSEERLALTKTALDTKADPNDRINALLSLLGVQAPKQE